MQLNVRKSWDLFSLGEYLEYQTILATSGTTNVEVYDKSCKILAFLAKEPIETIRRVPLTDVYSIFMSTTELLAEVPKGEIKTQYEFGGRKYKLCEDASQLTFGQFIDLCGFCKGSHEQILNNSAQIIATVLIPLDADGKPEDYLQTPHAKTVKSILAHMPVSEALSISAFFILTYLSYTAVTTDSLPNAKHRSSSDSTISKDRVASEI